jgi:hypothetical protein
MDCPSPLDCQQRKFWQVLQQIQVVEKLGFNQEE